MESKPMSMLSMATSALVRAHARVAGNEAVDRLAKRAAADAHFYGSGDDIVRAAQCEYEGYTTQSAPSGGAQPSTPPSASPSRAPACSAHFQPPVAAHSLGVG